MTDVTQILNAVEAGDPKAAAELLPLVILQLMLSLPVPMPSETDAAHRTDYGNPLRLSFTFLEAVLGTTILWRYPAMALRSLGNLELVFFAAQAAYWHRCRSSGL